MSKQAPKPTFVFRPMQAGNPAGTPAMNRKHSQTCRDKHAPPVKLAPEPDWLRKDKEGEEK